MDRKVCSSYGCPQPLNGFDTKGPESFRSLRSLKGLKSPGGPGGPGSRHGGLKGSPVLGSEFVPKRQKKVHFEPSSARKALCTLKTFTNRSIQAIKKNCHSHPKKTPEFVYSNPQWISDAAEQVTFSSPRSLRPPLRSCLQQRDPPQSLRSLALSNELYGVKLDLENDIESLIDYKVDTTAINSMWAPLSPTRHVPASIKGIEDLFD